MKYQNYVLNKKIKDTNKHIARDGAILTGCVFAVGIGIFGTVVLTTELIDFYNSGATLTLASRFSAEWQETKVGLATISVIMGGFGAYKRIPKLKENIQYRKNLKKELYKL